LRARALDHKLAGRAAIADAMRIGDIRGEPRPRGIAGSYGGPDRCDCGAFQAAVCCRRFLRLGRRTPGDRLDAAGRGPTSRRRKRAGIRERKKLENASVITKRVSHG